MKETIMPSTTLPASPSWEYSNGFSLSEDTDCVAIAFDWTSGDEDGFVFYLEWQENGVDDWHKVGTLTGASPAGVQNLLPIKGKWDKSDMEASPDNLLFSFPRRGELVIPGLYRIRVQATGSPKNPGSVTIAIKKVKV